MELYDADFMNKKKLNHFYYFSETIKLLHTEQKKVFDFDRLSNLLLMNCVHQSFVDSMKSENTFVMNCNTMYV